MKLFVFDYEGYSQYYYVMSSSPEGALLAVKKYMRERANKEPEFGQNIYGQKYRSGSWKEADEWEKATLASLPKPYYLKEYSENEVLMGEWD